MSDVKYRVVGVLPSLEALQAVVDKLEASGFDRAQFGVLASQADQPARAAYATAEALASDPEVETRALQEPESGGAATGALVGGLTYLGAAAAAGAVILTGGGLGIALAAVAAAGGAGGLVGALAAHGFQAEHAGLIEEQIAAGGVVLWIEPKDKAEEIAASDALKAEGASKVVVQGAA